MNFKIDELTISKLEELADISTVKCNSGENFLDTSVCLAPPYKYGKIKYAFNYKQHCGERDFESLDEAISIIKELKSYYHVT